MKRKTLTALTRHDGTPHLTSSLNRPWVVRLACPRLAARLLSCAASLAIFMLSSVASTDVLLADTPCDAYLPSCGDGICDCGQCNQPVPECGCGKCGRSNSKTKNPLYRSLDTVAGGIEKLFGLDRCCK